MFPDRQQGIGLIGALFLIVTVAALSVAIASLVRTSADAFSLDVLNQKALRAAESGAQLALNRTFAPAGVPSCATWSWTFDSPGLENCSVTVVCNAQSAGGQALYDLQSDAQCGSSARIAERSIFVRGQW